MSQVPANTCVTPSPGWVPSNLWWPVVVLGTGHLDEPAGHDLPTAGQDSADPVVGSQAAPQQQGGHCHDGRQACGLQPYPGPLLRGSVLPGAGNRKQPWSDAGSWPCPSSPPSRGLRQPQPALLCAHSTHFQLAPLPAAALACTPRPARTHWEECRLRAPGAGKGGSGRETRLVTASGSVGSGAGAKPVQEGLPHVPG